MDWFTSKRRALSLCESLACFHKLRIDVRFLRVISDIVEDKDTKLPRVNTSLLQCQKTFHEDYLKNIENYDVIYLMTSQSSDVTSSRNELTTHQNV